MSKRTAVRQYGRLSSRQHIACMLSALYAIGRPSREWISQHDVLPHSRL